MSHISSRYPALVKALRIFAAPILLAFAAGGGAVRAAASDALRRTRGIGWPIARPIWHKLDRNEPNWGPSRAAPLG